MTAPLGEGSTYSEFPWSAAQLQMALGGAQRDSVMAEEKLAKVINRLENGSPDTFNPDIARALGEELLRKTMALHTAVRAYGLVTEIYGVENVFYRDHASTQTSAEQTAPQLVTPNPEGLE
jgi:hypothetical protein